MALLHFPVFDKRRPSRRSPLLCQQFEQRTTGVMMAPHPDTSRPGFRYHLRVHFFRIVTVIVAWLLIAAAFYEKPELLTGAQRSLQRGIEAIGDAIPPPWGPRIEFVFREIGGLIWLQITLFVLVLRVTLSTIAAMWRFGLRRERGF